MHLHREPEIRRHAVGNIHPVVTPVVAPVQAPVILKKKSPRTTWVVNHLVHALPVLRIPLLLGHELGTDTGIARAPALSPVFRAVHSAGGHRDQHSPRVVRIEDNRVQAKSSAAGLPLGLMLVVEQSLIGLPALSSVARLEERGWLDAAIKHIGLGPPA
jgi:hypothetical protein